MSDLTSLKQQIGERVHDLRIDNKCTQAQFAESIDISINFLSEIENGKKGMSQETLYKICTKYQISADYLLLGKDPSMPPIVMTRITDMASSLTSSQLTYVINYLSALKKMKDLEL